MALTIAALNDLEVKVGDVLKAYITAPITEKVWTILGPEFGPDKGKSAIIVRALYGLKSAGAAFRAHLASFMQKMGYISCKADPDNWKQLLSQDIRHPPSKCRFIFNSTSNYILTDLHWIGLLE